MATARDSVYVDIIANTQGFTDKMKSAMQPLRQFVQVIQSVMALGGAAVIINKIVQAVGDMEKAYAKLHPESQKAVGSLKDWNDAMARMRGESGEIVSKVLSPIRAALLDIIDPAHRAKAALQEVTDLTAGWGKYTSADTKYKNEIAMAKQALEDARKATKDISLQISEYQRMQTQLGKRPNFGELTLKYQGAGYDSSAAQAQATQDIANYDQTLKFLSSTLKQLQIDLDAANLAIVEIPKWLGENGKGTKAVEDFALATSVATDAQWDFMTQLYASLDASEALRTGMKRGAEDARNLGRAMGIEKPGAGTKGGSEGKTHRISSWRATPEDVAALTEEWQKYSDLIVSISASLGEAFATGDYIEALRQMTAALLDFIAKEAIAAGLKMILAGNIPMGVALLAIGGITLGVSAGIRASDGGGGGGEGVELPRMAAGGVVTRPTLALIGEAGPEAVVPLGRGTGGTTIIVQGSIWQTEDLARAVADRMGRW